MAARLFSNAATKECSQNRKAFWKCSIIEGGLYEDQPYRRLRRRVQKTDEKWSFEPSSEVFPIKASDKPEWVDEYQYQNSVLGYLFTDDAEEDIVDQQLPDAGPDLAKAKSIGTQTFSIPLSRPKWVDTKSYPPSIIGFAIDTSPASIRPEDTYETVRQVLFSIIDHIVKLKAQPPSPPPLWSATFQHSLLGLIPSRNLNLNKHALTIQLWFKRWYIAWALEQKRKRNFAIQEIARIREDRARQMSRFKTAARDMQHK